MSTTTTTTLKRHSIHIRLKTHTCNPSLNRHEKTIETLCSHVDFFCERENNEVGLSSQTQKQNSIQVLINSGSSEAVRANHKLCFMLTFDYFPSQIYPMTLQNFFFKFRKGHRTICMAWPSSLDRQRPMPMLVFFVSGVNMMIRDG